MCFVLRNALLSEPLTFGSYSPQNTHHYGKKYILFIALDSNIKPVKKETPPENTFHLNFIFFKKSSSHHSGKYTKHIKMPHKENIQIASVSFHWRNGPE